MIGFLGEYEATVDAKGRFLLPAGIKKKLPEGAPNLFVINRGFEKCLTLYPITNWQPIMEGIRKLNDFDPKVREFRRYFFNGATELELDTAGSGDRLGTRRPRPRRPRGTTGHSRDGAGPRTRAGNRYRW